MAGINLPGLITGIDTNVLISQLMAVNRRWLSSLEARKSIWEDKRDALSTLETKLDAFRTTVRALDDANELRAYNVTTSDDEKITAEATYNAFEGNHTVVVSQLANSEQWVHTNGLEYAEDYVGAGTFIYSYNDEETTITTTSTTTLEDLVGLINNDANNPGVTASLLYYEGTYHLVLNGNEAGSDYTITISAYNTEVSEADSAFAVDGANATLSTKIENLDQFTSGTWGGDEKITFTGKDHFGNAISGEVNVNSNTKVFHLIEEINDAFDGRAVATLENGKIRLTDNTSGTSQLELLTLSYDQGTGTTDLSLPTMTQLVQGGSETANLTNFAASDFTQSQAAQGSKIKVDGFPSTSAVSEEQTLTPTLAPSAGTYTLTYEGQTTAAIQYNDGTATVQAALEALPNVSAGDVTVGGSATNGLKAGALTFTFLDTLGDVSLISIDPSGLTPSDNSNYTMVETMKGSDGYISRSSNTIDNVIPGVSLHLHDTTDVNGEEVNLTRDIDSVKDKLNKMVDAYNLAVAYIQEKAGYNEILETGGVLMTDYIVSSIRSWIRDPFIVRTSGFLEDVDTYLLPGDIGLELDRDGMLSLDANAFEEAVGEDYMDVLALIGAAKTGSSSSNIIEFYGASSRYTTPGTYDVQVKITSGAVEYARIKLSTESTYRDMTVDGNIATGDGTFDDDGDPVYAENGLQLSIDLSTDATYTATVYVKQGFAGALEDVLNDILRVTDGSIQIDQEYTADIIENLAENIEDEEERLSRVETRLVGRFARMEKALAILQSQLGAVGLISL